MKKNKPITIRNMLLTPMLSINLVIVMIFVATIVASNLRGTMKASEVSGLERAVQYRGENMRRLFSDLSGTVAVMSQNIDNEAARLFSDLTSDTGKLFAKDPEYASMLLGAAVPHITSALSLNEATGAFVLLDCSVTSPENGGISGKNMAGVYINDLDLSAAHAGNTDLSLFVGDKGIARDITIPFSNHWSVECDISKFENDDFIMRPFTAATNNAALPTERFGYWSMPFARSDGRNVVTYTMPLLDKNLKPYGIAGIELCTDHLKTKMPAAEIGGRGGGGSFYALIMEGSVSPPSWRLTNGEFFLRYSDFDSNDTLWTELEEYSGNVRSLKIAGAPPATTVSYLFPVYPANSLFPAQTWEFVGGVEDRVLYNGANFVMVFFFVCIFLTLIIGVFSSFMAANWFVQPIKRLARQLLAMDPDEEIVLEKTRIREIDTLISSIEQLSHEVAASGARTLETIEMTEMPIGFLEINLFKQRVFLTDLLFDMFRLEKKDGGNFISLVEWGHIYHALTSNRYESENNVYLLDNVGAPPQWLRVKTARSGSKTFGIVIDITDEILERKRLEYERDTDPLTGLLTRQAFFNLSGEKLRAVSGKEGVMLFADLDNLKYVNDTYGHDFGDRYIKAAAAAFSRFSRFGAVVSRISGDEFAIFLYGYDRRDQVVDIVTQVYDESRKSFITLPDGTDMRVRFSMGFSWYMHDSSDLTTLLKYADFAMYETKRTTKGSLKEFSLSSYMKNSYLVEKNEAFNQFIENNLVDYAFQPIVDVFSGNVFAYEALMRPKMSEFQEPGQVIEIARTQAKLYQIERMTIFNVHEWINNNTDSLGDRKIFYNTIPDQNLSDKDRQELESKYGHLFKNTVVEITEKEHSEEIFLVQKVETMRRIGCDVAIDDYGSGYSNDLTLLSVNPDYIKVDITLVKNLHIDVNKQKLVSNIVEYAHPRGIKVIGEGVETAEEAEAAIRLGMDYLQGFYLAVPCFDLCDISPEIKRDVCDISIKYRDRRSSRHSNHEQL